MSDLALSAAVPVTTAELAEYEAFSCELAMAAGQVIRPLFRSHLKIENKAEARGGAGLDPVTLADQGAEAAMRALIDARYPEHGIYGEEHGVKKTQCGLTWVLDPIDGTGAFIAGMLHWGVLVALFDGEKPILGVIYQPISDELFVGDGRRANLRRRGETQMLATRPLAHLEQAILCTTTPDCFRGGGQLDAFNRLSKAVRMRRFGGDCYLYALLAMGQIDLCVEASLQPYDTQALIPLVEGAGGRITSWEGTSAALGGTLIAAGDPRIHAQALEYLKASNLPA